ncbi:M23 family metallopeptidase [Methylobacterium oryzihabitans]|uniref:M23 family metallopeptidase n=1 Tax=Methylobacterium oryzihabitans TaxID=2499852 RepID=A0A437P4K5_9HYPH|nr:M23 family metallopeptidase [Methylobacterium oryzihabitans]RVU17209.1 M23 family metallopeptidase [Methylobacterium oryzihabitans]
MVKRTRPEPAVPPGVAARPGRTDPGHAPPLALLGGASPETDRRDVNLRWLAACVLAGMTGAGLLGSAIWISLQGEVTFADLPQAVAVAARPQPSDGGANLARKGDRLVRNPMVAVAKQHFRAPVALRVGEREIIKIRPFVRIATALSTNAGLLATDIPPFDPMRFFAEPGTERAPEPSGPDASEGEFSVVKRDLAEIVVPADAPALGDDDVAAQIEEERRLAAEAGRRAALPIAPQMLLSRALRSIPALPGLEGSEFGRDSGPFKSIEVRVMRENVTDLPKYETRPSEPPLVEDRDVAIRRGETLEAVLRANGALDEQIRPIVTALGTRARAGGIGEGQQMRLQIGPGPKPGDPRQLTRAILYGESGVEAIAAMNDRGAFVSVAPPVEEGASRKAVAKADDDDGDDEGTGPRLYASLYETAARHNLPRSTVEDLVRIFGYDVDFQRRVSSGDSIELVYTYDEEVNGGPEHPDLLSAALTVGGEQRKVYRFQSPDDGTIEYFDEAGRSLKKFLIRKPVADGTMSSGFGYRRHPVLGYAKLHTGVDWSVGIGTPIVAAGNGTVMKAEWDSGYGRRVEIQHANGYVTTYNHMSRFGRGVSAGARVRQGQVVGYVGSTGLSTGAHLHYEVVINGHFVDPMKIRVPRGRELDGRLLAEFRRQRDQTDGLVQKASAAGPATQREAMR